MDCNLTFCQKVLQVVFVRVRRANAKERTERLITHIVIFIYIPKIHEWLQPLDIKHVINQSMKGPCKHRTRHKRKHTHTHTHTRTRFKGTVTCIQKIGNLT